MILCVNDNFLNNVNGKAPGRSRLPLDPVVDQVYTIVEEEVTDGVLYYKLAECYDTWYYEATSFEELVSDEVLEQELALYEEV